MSPKDPIQLVRAAIEKAGITGVPYVVPGPTRIQVPPDAYKRVSMDRMKEMALGCQRCEALCQSRTRVVWGSGPVPAPLMFIGEAPGKEEDRVGYPFVGKSGQLLQRVFNETKIPRQLCRIDNALMCRPHENRDPTKVELVNCQPFLWRKIATVNPLVICTLGKFAANVVLRTRPGTNLKDLRGKRFILYDQLPDVHEETIAMEPGHEPPPPMREIIVLPTWHPASCFMDRGTAVTSRNKVQLTRDLRLVRQLVQQQMKLHGEYQKRS